jgi:hypothetical protein
VSLVPASEEPSDMATSLSLSLVLSVYEGKGTSLSCFEACPNEMGVRTDNDEARK